MIASFRDFDLAEEVFQDAALRALARWPEDGVPERPAAWLLVTARRAALDRLRRRQVRIEKSAAVALEERLRSEEHVEEERAMAAVEIPDERLRLLFTCCHPALAREAQVALTLRTLGGLSDAAVARAFLVPPPTMSKRLVRARRKIREAAIPYRVPATAEWAERLAAVLAVIYLVFNQGYTATGADPEERGALCDDALRMARALAELLPGETEALGLLALCALHDARRDARADAAGDLVPLEQQDPSRYDLDRAREGRAALEAALLLERVGPYQLQAAISEAHLSATLERWPESERWERVAALYAQLAVLLPSPVVEVNRAVAHGRAHGPQQGLAILDELESDPRVGRYQPYHAARADLLARARRPREARAAYERAVELSDDEAEKRFLRARAKTQSEA